MSTQYDNLFQLILTAEGLVTLYLGTGFCQAADDSDCCEKSAEKSVHTLIGDVRAQKFLSPCALQSYEKSL